MLTSTDRMRSLTRAWPLAFALLLVATMAAAQDDILVQTAEPDTAEQGTLDLEVMVGGENFPSSPEVEFLVNCQHSENPDCVEGPGGITVKKVKRQGPKNLKVTVSVADDAQVELFDIRVFRGGRSGKGTELFGVTKKDNGGQDTIPPGMPLDLQVLDVSFGSVTLSWTMPADDGYDPESGSVFSCVMWPDDFTGNPTSGCYSRHDDGGIDWLAPGETQVCVKGKLQPGWPYQIGVACQDEEYQWSPQNPVDFQTVPFSEVQDPSWSIQELPFAMGNLVGHGIDIDGKPIVVGVVVTGRGKGRWKLDTTAIRVATGVWDEPSGGWTWSFEDIDGFANRMLVDSTEGPVLAGLKALTRVNLPGGGYTYERQLEYTFHDGAAWTTEVVAADAGYYRGYPGFAFDPDGQPAIAWCYRSEGQPREVRLARRTGVGLWAVEAASGLYCESSGGVDLAFDDEGNPAILFNERLGPEGDSSDHRAWLARWTESGWVEEPLTAPQDGTIVGTALLFDAWRGDFVVDAEEQEMRICERAGAGAWQCEEPFLGIHFPAGEQFGSGLLAQDDLGELFLTFTTEAFYDVSLARRPPGATDWVVEHVDHFATKGPVEDLSEEQGPFLALDLTGLPTLSWAWNDVTYLAWKTVP